MTDHELPHLLFGRDRLPERERWCPAWPKNLHAHRDAAYKSMLRRQSQKAFATTAGADR